jgi:hypothetical protein
VRVAGRPTACSPEVTLRGEGLLGDTQEAPPRARREDGHWLSLGPEDGPA